MKKIKITIYCECPEVIKSEMIQPAVKAVMESVDDDEILTDLWDCAIDGNIDVKVEEI